MLKWFLVLGVLVAVGYQICVSVVHPVPTELEERDRSLYWMPLAILETMWLVPL